jgi:hypothetical protein
MIVIRMDDTTFLATWDDIDNVGLVNLSLAELKEFTTRNISDKGEHKTLMLKTIFSLVLCVLSEVGQEILMETGDPIFKSKRCIASTSEAREVPQIEKIGFCYTTGVCATYSYKMGLVVHFTQWWRLKVPKEYLGLSSNSRTTKKQTIF